MCLAPLKMPSPMPLSDGYCEEMLVPCGRCFECSRSTSTEWALRICLEASLYAANCCVTLTYDEEHVPRPFRVSKRDLQLFMKRLRKEISPQQVRFFASGEYGDKGGRPHYHVILFGYCPDDLVYKFTRNDREFYTSELVERVWGQGQVLVGMVDWHTAFYTAKYLQKQLYGNLDPPPFVLMSNRPGIGYNAVRPEWLATGKCYFNGKAYPLPRYFVTVLERDGFDIAPLKQMRCQNAADAASRFDPSSLAYRKRKANEFLRKH